jgi:hypothetical protein
MAEALRLDEAGVPVLYLHSVQWAQRSVGEIKAAG